MGKCSFKVFSPKIGIYSCLNEYMKLHEYKRSGSFFEHWTRTHTTWQSRSSNATRSIVTKFNLESSGLREQIFAQTVEAT